MQTFSLVSELTDVTLSSHFPKCARGSPPSSSLPQQRPLWALKGSRGATRQSSATTAVITNHVWEGARGRSSGLGRFRRKGHRSFGNLRPRGRSRPRLLPSNASSSPECRLIIRCPSGAQEGGARRRLRLPDFPGFGPHSLRRPNITWRQKVGGSIEASKIAGHANTKITEEYTIVQLKRQNELTRRRTDAPDSG